NPIIVFHESYCPRPLPLSERPLLAAGNVHRLSLTHPLFTLAREHLERIPARILTRAKNVLNARCLHNSFGMINNMIDHPANLMKIAIPSGLAAKESDLIFIHVRATNATAYSVYPPESFERYGWD